MRMSLPSVAPFMAAVALSLSAALSGFAVQPLPAAQDVLPLSPAERVVPAGSEILDASGSPVDSRATRLDGEALVVSLAPLEPGRYFVRSPRLSPGGEYATSWSSFVVVTDVIPGSPQTPGGSSPAWLLILGALGVGAVVGWLRGTARYASFAVAVVLWLVFAVTGSPSGVPVWAWAASLLALAGVGVAVAARPGLGLQQRLGSAALTGAGCGLAVGAPLAASVALVVLAWVGAFAWGRSSRSWVAALGASTAAVVALAVVPAASPAVWDETRVQVAACAELLRGDNPQVGLECYRGLGAIAGALRAPADATPDVLRLAEATPEVDPTQVCRQMGQGMSAAAARWGPGRDDPRALFVDLPAVCDYSSMHGIAPGVFATAPKEGLGAAVEKLCSAPTPDEARLPDYEYKAQCWQGAGIMLARKFAFDPSLFDVCSLAPREGLMNCSDGVFRELVDQVALGVRNPQSQFVPEGVTVASLCQDLEGDLAGGCYRYVGEEAELRQGTQDKTVGVSAVLDVCRGDIPTGHQAFCWYSVGMILVRAYPQESTVEVLGRAADVCAEAPAGEPFTECYVGAANAVLNRDWQDLEIEKLCEWFPEQDRARLCENARFYYGHLTGADSDRVRS